MSQSFAGVLWLGVIMRTEKNNSQLPIGTWIDANASVTDDHKKVVDS